MNDKLNANENLTVNRNDIKSDTSIIDTLKKPVISSKHPNKARFFAYIIAILLSIGLSLFIGYSYGVENTEENNLNESLASNNNDSIVEEKTDEKIDLETKPDMNPEELETKSDDIDEDTGNGLERKTEDNNTKDLSRIYLNKDRNIFLDYSPEFQVEVKTFFTVLEENEFIVPDIPTSSFHHVVFTKNSGNDEIKVEFDLKYLPVFGSMYNCFEPSTSDYTLLTDTLDKTNHGWAYEVSSTSNKYIFFKYQKDRLECKGMEGDYGRISYIEPLEISYTGPEESILDIMVPFLNQLNENKLGNVDFDKGEYLYVDLIKKD